ncbi:MAG: GNAT family N-acetyltransferase [Methylomonas lenta]|nr:GNAT family N-acetyltransferase [Methylomonas lenta]
MKSSIDITPATIDDIPALCELLAILFAQEAEFQPNRIAQQSGLAEIISNQAMGRIFLARVGSEVVGMISLLFTVSTALGGRVALLEDMVVSPAFRNAGIGSALLVYATAYARENGCRRITLMTDSNNLGAQRFYQSYGFDISSMISMRLVFDC